MINNMELIDIDRLREDLINYYGSAMNNFSIAMMDLVKIENASEEELISIAVKLKFDLNKYRIYINNENEIEFYKKYLK